MFYLWSWLIGMGITAIIIVAMLVITLDEFPDVDDIGPIFGLTLLASMLWFLSIPLFFVVVGAINLRKQYRTPVVNWLKKTFDEDED